MFFQEPFKRMNKTYNEYPQQFWILVMSRFIDQLGGALIFPFLTLYITRKFNASMTEVGVIFGIVAASGIVGSMLGGALSDRLGRKGMVIFGLLASAAVNLMLAFVTDIKLVYVGAVFIGLFGNSAGPAHGAMVADLLPEEKRTQGFGILRVVFNLAAMIGPAIGGLLAARSFMLLFICDVVSSTITAIIVAMALRETMPEAAEDEPEKTMAETFGGYGDILRDVTFMLFVGAFVLMTFVYMQMNTTLAVYLRDSHGIPAQGFGYLLSMNAAMVVLFQFTVTRRIAKYKPLTIMAVGTLLYAVGFGMYGFVSTYALFVIAMIIITIGEMFVAPNSQAMVSKFSPDNMRGRYMAVFGISGAIPWGVGPLVAGLIMDNADPRWLWYAAGLLGLVAAGCFATLQPRVEQRTEQIGQAEATVSAT
ncbi:MAG: MFS transporter [Chloroflexi bacterium]|nr:MFS transporter [Chloroflexota bacterium]